MNLILSISRLIDLRSIFRDLSLIKYIFSISACTIILVLTLLALNEWRADIYNALSLRDLNMFYKETLVFLALGSLYTFTYSIKTWFAQTLALGIRTKVDFALKPAALGITQIENKEQRIQEDIHKFTQSVTTLSFDLLYNILIAAAFIPIIYTASAKLSIFGVHNHYSLLCIIVFIIVLSSIVTYCVGINLSSSVYNTQMSEATYRKHLYNKICASLSPVLATYKSLFFQQKLYNYWCQGYQQILVIVPFILIGPSYFYDIITLGELMALAMAFDQVVSSVSYIINQYIPISELSAATDRLKEIAYYARAD